MPRQILQSKSGIFGEKFNEGFRKKDFLPAKAIHRNKSNGPLPAFGRANRDNLRALLFLRWDLTYFCELFEKN